MAHLLNSELAAGQYVPQPVDFEACGEKLLGFLAERQEVVAAMRFGSISPVNTAVPTAISDYDMLVLVDPAAEDTNGVMEGVTAITSSHGILDGSIFLPDGGPHQIAQELGSELFTGYMSSVASQTIDGGHDYVGDLSSIVASSPTDYVTPEAAYNEARMYLAHRVEKFRDAQDYLLINEERYHAAGEALALPTLIGRRMNPLLQIEAGEDFHVPRLDPTNKEELFEGLMTGLARLGDGIIATTGPVLEAIKDEWDEYLGYVAHLSGTTPSEGIIAINEKWVNHAIDDVLPVGRKLINTMIEVCMIRAEQLGIDPDNERLTQVTERTFIKQGGIGKPYKDVGLQRDRRRTRARDTKTRTI